MSADDRRIGPVRRSLLQVRDDRLRRCAWCGDWCWWHDDCHACGMPETAEHDDRKVG